MHVDVMSITLGNTNDRVLLVSSEGAGQGAENVRGPRPTRGSGRT